jgi:NAD+ kinase
MLKRALILHHPQSEGAAALALEWAAEFRRRGVACELADVWRPDVPAMLAGVGLVIGIGGDGTILRAARIAVGHGTPIAGVNMGRLGFLTDISPAEFRSRLDGIVAEDWRLEERIMVRADFAPDPRAPVMTFHGLNDIVVSRQSPGRPIYVDLRIDGVRLAVYRCDGIIVATPTGSTGYSLSAGGPILAPNEHHLVVTPVSPHLALGRSLVLQPEAEVELRVTSDHGAILSVDGQEDLPVGGDALVRVRKSDHVTHFVRFDAPSSFYGELAEKLDIQLSSSMSHRA